MPPVRGVLDRISISCGRSMLSCAGLLIGLRLVPPDYARGRLFLGYPVMYLSIEDIAYCEMYSQIDLDCRASFV